MNKLKLKAKKMEINLSREENIENNGETIEKINQIKYLGVILAKALKFNKNVS